MERASPSVWVRGGIQPTVERRARPSQVIRNDLCPDAGSDVPPDDARSLTFRTLPGCNAISDANERCVFLYRCRLEASRHDPTPLFVCRKQTLYHE
jgi:hypothetical protein